MGSLGEKLKQLRKARNLTQGMLAAKSEVHDRTISRIESGRELNPHQITILRLTRALGVDVSVLTRAMGVDVSELDVKGDDADVEP